MKPDNMSVPAEHGMVHEHGGLRAATWIKIVLVALIPMVLNLATVAYGAGQLVARMEAIEGRLVVFEQALLRHDVTIENTRLNVARLCQRKDAGCKE